MRFSVVCVLALCLFAASAAAHEVQLFAGGSGCSSTPTRHLSVTDNACYLTPDARQSLLVLCGADGNAAFTIFDTLDCSGDAAAQIASGSGKGDGNTCIASSSASIQAKVQCVSQRCTKTALVAMSSASELLMTRADGSTFNEPIGYYLPEAYYPVKAMLDAGWDLTFANPQGNTPPMDPTSGNSWYFAYNQTESDLALDLLVTRGVSNFKKPYKYQDLTIEQVAKFDALIIPGGHAPMVDLTNDPALGKIILQFYQSKKPIAAICHGPVAFLSAKSAFQPWIFENTTLTVFTDAADIFLESAGQWNATMPFLPGSKLRAENITVLASQQLFEPIVLQDRNIITGENPMSAPIFGQAVTAEVYRYCGIQVGPVSQANVLPGPAQDTPSSGPSKGALAAMLIGAAAAGSAVTALVLYLLARNAREKEVHMHMQPLV